MGVCTFTAGVGRKLGAGLAGSRGTIIQTNFSGPPAVLQLYRTGLAAKAPTLKPLECPQLFHSFPALLLGPQTTFSACLFLATNFVPVPQLCQGSNKDK